jgi:hypothetical protein
VPVKVQWVNQNPQLSPIQFIGQSTGWAAGESTLLSTSDGGANWNAQDLGFTYPMVVQFIDKKTGWIASDYGTTMLMTRDGGQTWVSNPTPPGISFYAAEFVDESTGWGANNDTIYKTMDGKTWQDIGGGVAKRPFFFTDASYGRETLRLQRMAEIPGPFRKPTRSFRSGRSFSSTAIGDGLPYTSACWPQPTADFTGRPSIRASQAHSTACSLWMPT